MSVQFNVYSGQDHDNAAVPFKAGALSFLTARLSGLHVSDGCSSIGAGNSLAPVVIPKLELRYAGASHRLRGVAWRSSCGPPPAR